MKKENQMFNKINVPFTADGRKHEITCDLNNFIVSRIATNKKGEKVYSQQKFFNSLESAMTYIVDLKVKGTESTSLEDLVDAIARAKREVMDMYSTAITTDDLDEAMGA